MKKCPQCNQLFDDVNDFCLNDGTPLFAHSTNPSYDAPTQFMKAPVTGGFQPQAKSASPMLYLVVGVLATALVAAGAYIYFASSKDESTTANKSAEQNSSQQAKQPETKATTVPAQSAPPLPKSGVSPAGNWSGDWSGKSSAFTATMSLSEANGAVDGRIVWTLTRTSNPKKIGMEGLAATEYVKGTYDAATRMVKIRGVRKDDPNGLIIHDNYNLSLTEDGTTMSGRSKNGNFKLNRR